MRLFAYGQQHDYLDDPHVIGWTRSGDSEHPHSGMAVIMSNAGDGTKNMYVGKEFAGESFHDAMGKCTEPVVISDDGNADFYAPAGRVAVWVRKEAFESLAIND